MSDPSLVTLSLVWTLCAFGVPVCLLVAAGPARYRCGATRLDWLGFALVLCVFAWIGGGQIDQHPAFHHYGNSPLHDLVFPPRAAP